MASAPVLPDNREQSSQPSSSSSSSAGTPRSLSLPLGPCFPPFLVVDVASGLERRAGTSYQNPTEAAFVAAFVDRLAAAASGLRRGRGGCQGSEGRGGVPAGSGGGVVRVGVITPYRGQVQCIRQELGSGGSGGCSGGGGSRWLKGGGGDGGGVEVEVRETSAV